MGGGREYRGRGGTGEEDFSHFFSVQESVKRVSGVMDS